MIQRIQSVWLLVAALFAGGLFFFDMYHAHAMVNNMDTLLQIKVSNDYLLLLVALLITILPLATIFFFKNRKRQQNMITLTMVLTLGFLAYMLILVTNMNNRVPQPTQGSYWIGAVLPVVSMMFLIMAGNGIKKDEKLVKSLDRLR